MDRAGLGTGPAVTNSTRLWRPVGPDELLLIAKSGMKEFPPRLPEQAGGREHEEYWIPAEDLPDFNRAIVGHIRVVKSFPE